MRKVKVTIDEVARQAGVSIATVSRVFNNKGPVRPETREKVLETAKALSFSFASPASSSAALSRLIVMCVPDFDNPFDGEVINGAEAAAHLHGYDILILHTKNYENVRTHLVNMHKAKIVSGLLILSPTPNSNIVEDIYLKFPVVMCSEYPENRDISFVSIDDVAAARTAVNYLISTGRKKIALINGNYDFRYARHREKGYKASLSEAGLELDKEWILHLSSMDYNLAFSMATHLLSLPNRPDAVFACSDVFAVAAINAAKRLGLSVPQDVSVVGFDNIPLAIMSDPQISTIEQPAYQIGYQACELLLDKFKNPASANKQILLDTQLILRGSTSL